MQIYPFDICPTTMLYEVVHRQFITYSEVKKCLSVKTGDLKSESLLKQCQIR